MIPELGKEPLQSCESPSIELDCESPGRELSCESPACELSFESAACELSSESPACDLAAWLGSMPRLRSDSPEEPAVPADPPPAASPAASITHGTPLALTLL